jgi:RNA polymerase sigma-70 factor, ECF subfamily
MTPDATDEYLASQAQAGDKEAFLALYDRYLNKVYNRVKSKIPPQDVEDVTQDIFIAVVRSLGGFEQRSRFNTWLYTIVNRQIADFYRKRSRKNEHLSLSLEHTEHIASAFAHEDTDQRMLVQHALNSLPEHYQDIVLCRFADGLTFAEIADQRGQSLEAVKSLYRRAIQAIRDNISGA